MKIYGRLTIYGEYLMHRESYGLIEKANLYLATQENVEIQPHSQYNIDKDFVFRILEEKGIKIHPGVKGNLPLGYGLASSSVFSFLYLYPLYGEKAYEIIKDIDRDIHGFEPSGLDVSFCYRQKRGLYRNGEWLDVKLPQKSYSLFAFPKEEKISLYEISKKITNNRNMLKQIADSITSSIVVNNHLPYEELYSYATELINCDIYSGHVKKFISYYLSHGIVAKGIGGLYDKAVLVVWPESVSDAVKQGLLNESMKWDPLSIFEDAGSV